MFENMFFVASWAEDKIVFSFSSDNVCAREWIVRILVLVIDFADVIGKLDKDDRTEKGNKEVEE